MRARALKPLAIGLLAVLATALTLSATVGAQGKRGHRGHHGALKAKLTGAQEVPGPGDADGRGRALVKLLPRFGGVCFALEWRNIAEPTAAHIHRGVSGVAGDIVVGLFDSTNVRRKGCVDGVDEALLREIRRSPSDFYVNVHNADFPNGAIRGQLKRTGRHRGFNRRSGERRR